MNDEYAALSLIKMMGSTWKRVTIPFEGVRGTLIHIDLGEQYIQGENKSFICATWREAYEKLAERMRQVGPIGRNTNHEGKDANKGRAT